ncbi:MAG TPA: acyltransferase family protein [Steroidobacteraceae bacterium]|nr:acyltransferase family protein [Steroidobacteraceae bacterium]
MGDTQERYDFLDWLRVIAIFVLLFFHTGMIFVRWGWHIVNAETIPALQFPMDILHRLRMPLLFVIAGAGMWFALQRRTPGQLVRERTRRLLLPLLIGMLLIVPPQIYYERLFRGQWSGDYLGFFWTRVLELHPYPHGDFSWHHLWFILYLYVYVLVLLPALLWWKQHVGSMQPGSWLYLLALPLGVNEALLRPLFPEAHNLVSDWYLFAHYLLLTAYGYVIASLRGGWKWLSGQRVWALLGSVTVLAAVKLLFAANVIHSNTASDALTANLFSWLCVMAFLGYGYRYLSFVNPLLRWARDASYPVYIMHQTIIVVIGYYVIQSSWTPWTKYFVIVALTLAACFALYEGCIRRLAPLRFAFGMKALRTAAPARPAAGPVLRPMIPDDVQ